MKQVQLIMGMPISVEIVDPHASEKTMQEVFDYFRYVDETFSTYKDTSEISRFNAGKITKNKFSKDVKEIFQLAEDTKVETNGYFNIEKKGYIDPSGIVKGWAIYKVAQLLLKKKYNCFMLDAGGDIQVSGKNAKGEKWTVGIRNPFNLDEIIKVLVLDSQGVATSGTYNRGQHIYNPHHVGQELTEIASITVIGPNIYDADRFATAAFAMGKKGITFIESLPEFEGYMIDSQGLATMTTGFTMYTQ